MPLSSDTGFQVLTPTEVASAEEGKDPEQFGFDVSFFPTLCIISHYIGVGFSQALSTSLRPQNQIDWHCPGYHWVLRLPTRPSAGCSSPTRSPSCSSPMFQLFTLKAQCHTSFKPQCHNLFIFSLLSCSWKNAVFIHIWPNIVRHCLGPNEEQQSSFSGVLLLARSSYSSPPKIDIDILFSSLHRQGLNILLTQTFDLLITTCCHHYPQS